MRSCSIQIPSKSDDVRLACSNLGHVREMAHASENLSADRPINQQRESERQDQHFQQPSTAYSHTITASFGLCHSYKHDSLAIKHPLASTPTLDQEQAGHNASSTGGKDQGESLRALRLNAC